MLHGRDVWGSLRRDGKVERRERIGMILNADLLKPSLKTNRKLRDHLAQALFSVGFEGIKGHTGNMFRRQL